MLLDIEQVREDMIDADTHAELRELLDLSFPGYFTERSYFKQLPHFRYLGKGGGDLIGHVALDHRVIQVDGQPHRIYGIVDLCVHPEWRGRTIGRALLAQVEKDARAAGVDSIILFADNQRLYEECGYVSVENECTWLAIDEHKSIDVRSDSLADCMMVKSLKLDWTEGPVDLLGYLF